jgi:hypothetical protein
MNSFFVSISSPQKAKIVTSFKETCHASVPGSVDIFGFFRIELGDLNVVFAFVYTHLPVFDGCSYRFHSTYEYSSLPLDPGNTSFCYDL